LLHCGGPNAPIKPRRKRGRKRSNLSPEERRARRLERGRLAANKCRKKKREMECELEARASDLLLERDRMMKINDGLKDEIRELQAEILKHVGSECGLPEAANILSTADLLKSPQKANNVGHQSQSLGRTDQSSVLQRREGGLKAPPGWISDTASRRVGPSINGAIDPLDCEPVEVAQTRSAEDIVRAVLGGRNHPGP